MKEEYRESGFALLRAVIPAEQLEVLRSGCQRCMEMTDAEMDREGVDIKGSNHRRKRYFISSRHKEISDLREFIFSDLMSEICSTFLGPTAYLFFEQFVIKCAEVGMKFGWHQDSAYVIDAGYPQHRPFLTCWCALDDVSEENGTIYFLRDPGIQAGQVIEHVQDSESADLVGYHGTDPGVPFIAPAGSIALFSSTTFHRSGPNTTSAMRRAYVVQYSTEPIRNETGLMAFAEPFLRDGKRFSI